MNYKQEVKQGLGREFPLVAQKMKDIPSKAETTAAYHLLLAASRSYLDVHNAPLDFSSSVI